MKLLLLIYALMVLLNLSSATETIGIGEEEEDGGDSIAIKKRFAYHDDDLVSAETGAFSPGSKGAKYFMYAHQPDKKQYEFGFKRGTEKHSIERYEKAGPKHNFKTKVRWNDEKGGHGEHYWDYNHTPKHHDDHKGGHGKGHGGGYHSEPVPDYIEASVAAESQNSDMKESPESYENFDSDSFGTPQLLKRSGLEKKSSQTYGDDQKSQNNYSPVSEAPSAFPHLLGYDPYVPPQLARRKSKSLSSSKTYRRKPRPQPIRTSTEIYPAMNHNENVTQDTARSDIVSESKRIPKLAYDLDSGRVYEEESNTWYDLVPLDNDFRNN